MEGTAMNVTLNDRIYCLKASSDYHSELCEECKFYPNCDHMTQDDLTEMNIKDLESNRWIPIEESLPPKAGEYLVTYHPCWWENVQQDIIKVGLDNFRGKTTWAKNKFQKIIAWKELPQPYEELK